MAGNRRCSLVAMSMINALGASAEEIWPRLLAGDQSGFAVREDLVPGVPMIVAQIGTPLPPIPKRLERYDCRNNAILLAALEQLEKPISDVIERFGRDRIGVVIGTSTSGVSDAEIAIRHRHETGELAKAFRYDQLEFGGAANFVAEWVGVGGPSYAISTACSSGARALATARSLLALGICDAVIAGGSDSLGRLTTNGFSSLQVVSNSITNPYSANRSGLTLGEGATLFLCTRDPAGIQLAGVGESTEAHHMSAPDPDGRGAEQAMRGALADAQLGAAGVVEAGFCWLTLREAGTDGMELIPHVFDGVPDPEIETPPLVAPGTRVPRGPVMTNSFGFGGNNCTLILDGEFA